MPSINLYAELLLNLQQVTVFASLKSCLNGKTLLDLSSDLETISVSHEGEIARIRLPTRVAGNTTLKLPTAPVTELSFRLPVLGNGHPANLNDAAANNYVPWSAGNLTSTTQISCRTCNEILVDQSAIAIWKDLPSENWAEMMDFWHCHKPDHEGHDEAHDPNDAVNDSQKGYTATSRLFAKSGVGFVDLCYLLLAKKDCFGIQGNRKEPVPELSFGIMDRSPIQLP
ncbi:MAG: hypothetical protein M1830_004182 [Pleopsidium flavum]|nr:MAG: hypothetical protein M1830_004182 [Pleopsidium flavum]